MPSTVRETQPYSKEAARLDRGRWTADDEHVSTICRGENEHGEERRPIAAGSGGAGGVEMGLRGDPAETAASGQEAGGRERKEGRVIRAEGAARAKAPEAGTLRRSEPREPGGEEGSHYVLSTASQTPAQGLAPG